MNTEKEFENKVFRIPDMKSKSDDAKNFATLLLQNEDQRLYKYVQIKGQEHYFGSKKYKLL